MNRLVLYFFAFFFGLSGNVVLAQNIKWDSAPNTGFVFQISNREAEKLLTKSRPDTIVNSLLHTQIDTFNVRKGWTERPSKGHFILVKILGNKLYCEYTSVFPYQVLLLKEYNALSLQVLDQDGNVRDDARVKFKTRRIHFDQESKTYRLDNDWFNGSHKIVTVELDGFRSVFNVEKHEAPSWSNDYYHDDGPDFYSYMITDKNRYKPGERVRFKSYALSGSRNPIRKDLEVWVMRSGEPIKVGVVSPHRPGSFVGEIQLHDSLGLTLDQFYTLQLWEKRGRVVANCSFKYEDYELHGNRLELELNTQRHFHPANNSVKIKATSENGLMLKDARATITVLTENVREIFQPVVLLPDTLMIKEFQLDSDDASIVEIPSSLFQKSNVTYHVHVAVVNSQNQRMESSVAATHLFSHYELTATFSNDSIVYQVLNNGSPMQNVQAKVYRDHSIQGVDVMLPHKEKINPALSTIRLQTDSVSRFISMDEMLPKIDFVGGIQKDSFNISIVNPQAIQVSWFIYQGSVLLEKGFGTEIDFKSKIEDRTITYYVELLYSFGGSDRIKTKEFQFKEGLLHIALNLPDRVYPGQLVDATIEVTDDQGNEVSGVDLTALATTAKLNYFIPDLPYYRGISDSRSAKATYSKRDVNKHAAILDLDYGKWAPRARLDTMKYYQFAYPGTKTFVHKVPIKDNTQFSIYVMKNGAAKEVYVVEVDRTPAYYSWTDHPKAYSLYVQPEKNKQVTLRLHDRVLIFDSLCFDAGKKTILSVDLDQLPKDVRVVDIAPKVVFKNRRRRFTKWVFTDTEVRRHTAYLAAFQGSSNPAYLIEGEHFVPVSAGDNARRNLIVGPILQGSQTYVEHGVVKTTYKHSGGFSYAFEDNIVYKSPTEKLMPEQLLDRTIDALTSINDLAITKRTLLHRDVFVEKWHPRVIDLVDHACRLKVLLPFEAARSGVASVLFRDCGTNQVVSPCKGRATGADYFTLPRGCQDAIVLYNNGSFLQMDSVTLRSHSTVVIEMKTQSLQPADSTSMAWLRTLSVNCYGAPTSTPPRTLNLTRRSQTIGNVHGAIFDESNTPLPGAVVVVKGTTIGASTDINGRFILDIPEDPSTLVVSFIGYMTKEIQVTTGSEISIVMEPDIQSLQEVIVVGYSSVKRSELTGAVSTVFSGRLAGVTVSQQETEADSVYDRSSEPTREAEQRLYQELLTLKNIRSQFSDVALWEPRLVSDRHGRSKFSVKFPDDITRWDAVVYGMNRQLQTGTARKSIKSYKPLMAELSVPQFLTVGDSADFIGKVVNYTSDKSIIGKTQWKGSTVSETDIRFGDYHTEKFQVIAGQSDTVITAYSFTRDDGYFDGEQRKVPTVHQGTIRANGSLRVLKNNDEVHVKSKAGETITVEIFDAPLDLYAQDVRYLLNYKYDCNEQLASKLIGLVNHKLIMKYEGKAFDYDKDVNKIIQRLLKNQNTEFLWSWWDVSSNTSYWMSAHILRALKAAKDAGYVVNLDVQNVVRKASYKFDFLNEVTINDVEIIHALAMWGAEIEYGRYVKILDAHIMRNDSVARQLSRKHRYARYSSLNKKMMLLEIRQLRNLPFASDSLLRYQRRTVLNEVYFSDGLPARYWHSGDLSSNVIAYRIISRDSVLRELKVPLQMYFLSLRRNSTWNTYEVSNVLLSILPDVLEQKSTKKVPTAITLGGKEATRVVKFPHRIELIDGEELRLRKDSGVPVYLMQYSEERVVRAKAGTDAFQIKTEFNGRALAAGKPTVLKATVEVKHDASLEHVMIEIPIPAGCSYADKRQVDNRVETHREYFKERTVIFCEQMTPGTYVFQVHLLPRFTGKYRVNPAQMSLMYFPVINANTDLKRIEIED